MKLPVVHVFTHDSIGLGEDGPTHQPVEYVSSLRPVPGLDVGARRCHRNGGGLARVAAPRRWPERAGAQPPGPAACRRGGAGAQRGHRARRLRAATSPRANSGADRHRLGSAGRARRGRAAGRGGHRRARRLGALHRRLPSARTRATAPRSSRAGCRASRWEAAAAACGGNTWARTATWSGWTASANRRPPATCSASSASPPRWSRVRHASGRRRARSAKPSPLNPELRGTPTWR